nr:MAG TPA: hypothetical protein [Caudoviricetes sp.]
MDFLMKKLSKLFTNSDRFGYTGFSSECIFAC